MSKPKIKFLWLFFILLVSAATRAQENLGTYQIRVVPDEVDWTYELNQTAKFQISATLNGNQVAGLPLKYACRLETMPPPIEKTVTTTARVLTIDGGTLKEAGFLRCIATVEMSGKTYRGLATAAFRPDQIKPTTTEPTDFDKFWDDGKKDFAKLPIDAKFEPLPGFSTSAVDVFPINRPKRLRHKLPRRSPDCELPADKLMFRYCRQSAN